MKRSPESPHPQRASRRHCHQPAPKRGAVRTDGGRDEPPDGDDDLLRPIARDAYELFEELETGAGLVPDYVVVDGDRLEDGKRETSPSNVAMSMLATVSADELDFVDTEEARDRLANTLDTLEDMEKWNGLFYRWYDPTDGSLVADYADRHISTVDNGHLTAALAIVGQAYPDLHDRADALLEDEDYSSFLSEDDGLLLGAYYFDRGDGEEGFGDWTYDYVNSETRVASYCAIGKGDFPKDHWWRANRTEPPDSRTDTLGPDGGEWRTYDGVDVYEGYYEHAETRFVPSWGGALFESLMPGLYIDETLSENAWAPNGRAHVDLHARYAEAQGWPAWGFSACGLPDGYGVFGAPHTGAWTDGYRGEPWVTPHATGLAAMVDADAARENFRALLEFDVNGPYGLYDSVNVETGEVTEQYYTLDQGMLICGIANALTDGALREYFHADPIGSRPEELLERERFSI